ncbi:protein C19orf12 homolog isoform X2 [Myxocyprinus asiaticus]|uniref:protein C19orf12 homolog isoform X2 n=1 Tax=Myxocyprinus asiaticus TaxID=70543 RepID=UPI0022223B33|nr:protein C19orf12 homolog isoform X2 [Myxocyprinus asiaticus]
MWYFSVLFSSSHLWVKGQFRVCCCKGVCLHVTMSSRMDDVMRLCCEVSARKNIKAAVKNSGKGAAAAGGSAFVGGLVGGPVGIAVGGALGGALGWWMTSGEFQPLHEIIIELLLQQKIKLYSDVMEVLGKLDWVDLAQLIFLVMWNSSMYMRVLSAVLTFAKRDLVAKLEY